MIVGAELECGHTKTMKCWQYQAYQENALEEMKVCELMLNMRRKWVFSRLPLDREYRDLARLSIVHRVVLD